MLADDGALQVFYTEAPVSGVVFKGERIVASADTVHQCGTADAQDSAGFFGTHVLLEGGGFQALEGFLDSLKLDAHQVEGFGHVEHLFSGFLGQLLLYELSVLLIIKEACHLY